MNDEQELIRTPIQDTPKIVFDPSGRMLFETADELEKLLWRESNQL